MHVDTGALRVPVPGFLPYIVRYYFGEYPETSRHFIFGDHLV